MAITFYRAHMSNWDILSLRVCWCSHGALLHYEEAGGIEESSAEVSIVFVGGNVVGVRNAEMG